MAVHSPNKLTSCCMQLCHKNISSIIFSLSKRPLSMVLFKAFSAFSRALNSLLWLKNFIFIPQTYFKSLYSISSQFSHMVGLQSLRRAPSQVKARLRLLRPSPLCLRKNDRTKATRSPFHIMVIMAIFLCSRSILHLYS